MIIYRLSPSIGYNLVRVVIELHKRENLTRPFQDSPPEGDSPMWVILIDPHTSRRHNVVPRVLLERLLFEGVDIHDSD